ncbi:tetratricopeptide repeat protein [Chryseobacterium caseinilyticum]|uniref:Tetratricopeptide repeat protein n=1 Tax=Chryseobacterium caseinilyticum TaxID=2771428 RepID=A0ABR8Z6T0_9FLAO|nr:tetratricopeptide repeat protein [Chryseobacterium caseinilyticum]MBD8080916.1 tetratricopeptide repeat protein [Chryseobacterium caseinilyticum]
MKTKEDKFLVGSKYIELFIYPDDEVKQINTIYEMMRLNNGKSDIITVICNFSLALKFEKNSPTLAMSFIDRAITLNESIESRNFLPHLYHAKGRFYYNQGSYSKALQYFEKSLKTLPSDQKLYIASMYNNFGLTYNKLKNNKRAVNEVKTGIKILESKKPLTSEESLFLAFMKGNLALYCYELGDYSEAEQIFIEEQKYYLTSNANSHLIIKNYSSLYELYSKTGQNKEAESLTDKVRAIEPSLKTGDAITANEILNNHYSKSGNVIGLKITSEKLIRLNNLFDHDNEIKITRISDLLNKHIITQLTAENENEVKMQRNKNIFLLFILFSAVIVSAVIYRIIQSSNQKQLELVENRNLILEKNQKILEKDIDAKNEKLKNFHQNLHLKIETEKAFLENLKKIRKIKVVDAEELLKDLFFKVNSLMQIDERNFDLIHDSYLENDKFIAKISEDYPSLTAKELKLCVYFRMNLNSKEISTLENTTMGTIRVYKTKIKMKMNLDKDQDLSEFLSAM